MPENFVFKTRIEVRISDMNYGNHLSNDVYLALLHEARMRFLHAYQFTEMDICGASFIMADSAIVYKKEVFYGDLLWIEVQPTDFWARGCDLCYRLRRDKDQEIVAEAKTGMVFFNYTHRKTQEVPEGFKSLFRAC